VLMEDEEDPGHEIILAYLNQGDFIGELGLFFRTSSRSTMVRARTECTLAAIKYDELNRLFENELKDIHAQIMTAVGRQLAQRLLSTSRKVGQLAFLDVTGRVARTLLEMCDAPEAMSHPDGTQIHISRQEIARNVGCSREMAGRVLRSLADQGMIRARGMDIVVLHPR
ncbi:MAG: helix-turn-helix domain-containing protein, partial [Thiohalomonadales bacterium]|nr:helix-turn-helix domain-containing protein [Thiohalomonadales bacterium]